MIKKEKKLALWGGSDPLFIWLISFVLLFGTNFGYPLLFDNGVQ